MAKENVMKEKERMNPFLWFLFAIIIPGIIAITLTMIVLAVAGVDVVGWMKNTGNNIPVLSSMIVTDEEKRELERKENIQQQLAKKDETIEQLSAEKTALEGTISRLEKKIETLEEDLAEARKEKEEQPDPTMVQIASSFMEMDSKQAATILEQLEKDAAFLILKELPNDSRGLILASMSPDIAADITKMFISIR